MRAAGPDAPGDDGRMSTTDTPDPTPSGPRLVVLGQDGRPTPAEAAAGPDREPGEGENPAALVDQPTKVMRIGTMVKQLLEEVRSAPLDEAARTRLAEVHARSIRELEDGLSRELVEELRRLTLPLGDGATPSDAELRVAQAQLVGWLEGLFHGIQTALVAQRMASQAQLAQARHALPPGVGPAGRPGPPGHEGDVRPTPGQYL
jgi:Protein of unknown function (DUF2587)